MPYHLLSSNGLKSEFADASKTANRLTIASSTTNRKVGDCVEKVIRNQFIVVLQHDRVSSNTLKCAMTVPTSANFQLSGSTLEEKKEAWEELKKQVDNVFNNYQYVIDGIPLRADALL